MKINSNLPTDKLAVVEAAVAAVDDNNNHHQSSYSLDYATASMLFQVWNLSTSSSSSYDFSSIPAVIGRTPIHFRFWRLAGL